MTHLLKKYNVDITFISRIEDHILKISRPYVANVEKYVC